MSYLLLDKEELAKAVRLWVQKKYSIKNVAVYFVNKQEQVLPEVQACVNLPKKD